MKYDAIIFDIDGTLWNASAVSAKGMNKVLKDLNIPKVLSVQDIKKVSGKPSNQVLHILLGEVALQHPEIIQSVDDGERAAIEAEGGLVFDGVREGMKTLSQYAKIFLVSNCDGWYLEAFMKFSDLSPYITASNCYGISGLTKADMIKDIVKTHRISHAVYIGDTSSDQKAAEMAGIDFIGAAYGFGDVSTAKSSFRSFSAIVESLLACHA